jgi:hypothetical protein
LLRPSQRLTVQPPYWFFNQRFFLGALSSRTTSKLLNFFEKF